MVEITNELYEKYNKRFPEPMTYQEMEAVLDRMHPQEAEEYDTIICNEIICSLCSNYIKFNQSGFETLTSSEVYGVFKRRSANLSSHIFYDAWMAFLEGRKKDVKTILHD